MKAAWQHAVFFVWREMLHEVKFVVLWKEVAKKPLEKQELIIVKLVRGPMFKLTFLFLWLYWLLGNPIIAILVLLVVLYLLDRRFVGISPSIVKPLKRLSRIRKLKAHIAGSPNDVSAKQELARLLIERKKFKEALQLLEPLQRTLEDSAEYWDALGHSQTETGNIEQGIASMNKALELNPRVKYGAPYLRLADIYANTDAEKALDCLRQFQQIQSSSCEAYYRMLQLYSKLGRQNDAKEAAKEGLMMYRTLPRYKKRSERGYAVRLLFKK
jgi:tetratricopeptide (TPR) repeat protein